MSIVYILTGLLVIILLVSLFDRYNPKIDLIVSNHKYIILFWYNKYNFFGDFDRRTYKKICEFRCGKF